MEPPVQYDLAGVGRTPAPLAKNGPMTKISRRSALKLTLFSSAALLIGCGGGGNSTSANPPPAGSATWDPALPLFLAGSTQSFDLTETLPSTVAKGGTFGVAANGTSLPAGMTLSPAGIITVGGATIGQTTGVAFTYTEPGT